jgi:hypothetical protein
MSFLRIGLIAALALACAPAAGLAQSFAYEDRDWGAPAQAELKRSPYHGATPREAPGAKTILTIDLKRLIDSGAQPVLIDVLSGNHPQTLAGAVWMPDGGHGTDVGRAHGRRSRAPGRPVLPLGGVLAFLQRGAPRGRRGISAGLLVSRRDRRMAPGGAAARAVGRAVEVGE